MPQAGSAAALPPMHPVDPHARQIRKRGEVVVSGQQLGFEAAHMAGRCAATLDAFAADNRRIPSEPVGIVHVLVSGEAAIDCLAKQTDEAVPAVLAGPAIGQNITHHRGQAQGIVKFTVGEQTSVGRDA